MSHKQYNEKFMSLMYKSSNPIQDEPIKKKTHTLQIRNISLLAPEHIEQEPCSSIKGYLKEYNEEQTNDEDVTNAFAKKDNEKVENNEVCGVSEDSKMSVLWFRSFILKIDGLDTTNYTAIERILTMDTNSEESIIQAAQEYCQDTE